MPTTKITMKWLYSMTFNWENEIILKLLTEPFLKRVLALMLEWLEYVNLLHMEPRRTIDFTKYFID